jgi:hypothetical protein
MNTRKSLPHVRVRSSGTARSARRDRSAGTDLAHAAREILVSALLLGAAVSAGVAASLAHGGGHSMGTHRAAVGQTLSMASPMSAAVGGTPWML